MLQMFWNKLNYINEIIKTECNLIRRKYLIKAMKLKSVKVNLIFEVLTSNKNNML